MGELTRMLKAIEALDPLRGPNLLRSSGQYLREATKPDGTKVLVFHRQVPFGRLRPKP